MTNEANETMQKIGCFCCGKVAAYDDIAKSWVMVFGTRQHDADEDTQYRVGDKHDISLVMCYGCMVVHGEHDANHMAFYFAKEHWDPFNE